MKGEGGGGGKRDREYQVQYTVHSTVLRVGRTINAY